MSHPADETYRNRVAWILELPTGNFYGCPFIYLLRGKFFLACEGPDGAEINPSDPEVSESWVRATVAEFAPGRLAELNAITGPKRSTGMGWLSRWLRST